MKRVYVNEEWCLGCHLCEYNCAIANNNEDRMMKARKERNFRPNINIEENKHIHFAVSCRHCDDAICLKSCISGALTKKDGLISVNKEKCIGCLTCVLVCPYGAVHPDEENGAVAKCEFCTTNLKANQTA
ncbi:4Fe-4S dicluster domain-containing protein, partial [Anaerofustis stercorihominis]|uniref:4Fe-4S dicluster domain-containing protein n=1 Tax=Anaerofustis stercorihominis TaxID=214853 RepID=UPI002671CCD9